MWARRSSKTGLAAGLLASLISAVAAGASAADGTLSPTTALDVADAGGASSGAPSGPWLELEPRFARRPVRACSFRRPLCVHADARDDGAAVLAALEALERAWDAITGPLRLPPPDVDPDTLAYDVVLERGVEGGWDTRPVARDVRTTMDRALAQSAIDASATAGCALDTNAFRALARASLYRVAAGASDGVALAQVAYLAQLAVPCSAALAADEASVFQAHPDRAVADARAFERGASALDPPQGPRRARSRASRLFAGGAALYWARLDWAFGKNPGDVVRASWTLAPTRTPVGAARWVNEPDAFDVLRVSFKGTLSTGSTVADAMLDVAVARAFMGAADDGVHQPETRALGDAARVRYDWDVPWPTEPRRLAPRAPVAPTGSSYVVVRTGGARPGARLRVEAVWEEHALFRWALVKVDAAGRELGRIVVPTRERAVEAQMTLVELGGVDRVLVVAVNTGDPAYPFDPDDEVWEPHGWLLTIAEE